MNIPNSPACFPNLIFNHFSELVDPFFIKYSHIALSFIPITIIPYSILNHFSPELYEERGDVVASDTFLSNSILYRQINHLSKSSLYHVSCTKCYSGPLTITEWILNYYLWCSKPLMTHPPNLLLYLIKVSLEKLLPYPPPHKKKLCHIKALMRYTKFPDDFSERVDVCLFQVWVVQEFKSSGQVNMTIHGSL